MENQKLISARLLAANRASAGLSKGKKSHEGIARSAQNARRHGAFAKTQVLKHESREALDDLSSCYHERFAPADAYEASLIDQAINAEWSFNRMNSIERTLLNDHATKFPDADGFDRINRYRNSSTRHLERALQFTRTAPGLRNHPNQENDQTTPP